MAEIPVAAQEITAAGTLATAQEITAAETLATAQEITAAGIPATAQRIKGTATETTVTVQMRRGTAKGITAVPGEVVSQRITASQKITAVLIRRVTRLPTVSATMISVTRVRLHTGRITICPQTC